MDASKEQAEELYRAAVGDSKAGYYLPLFERFDQPGTSRASWNWPSLFVTFFWMIYRRMYGWALAYFFLWPVILATMSLVLLALAGEQVGTLLYALLFVVAQFVLVPLYANALYHRSVKRRIRELSVGAPSHDAVVQRLLGRRTNVVAIIAIACAGLVPLLGILAAIAIPAYQDYVIRAQVADGMKTAESAQESVARAYRSSGELPEDVAAAELDIAEPRSEYVESIDVQDGVVLIHYGKAAHHSIAGRTLALEPVNLSDDSIEWSCGYADPTGAGSSNGLTDVLPRHLPRQCRPPADSK